MWTDPHTHAITLLLGVHLWLLVADGVVAR